MIINIIITIIITILWLNRNNLNIKIITFTIVIIAVIAIVIIVIVIIIIITRSSQFVSVTILTPQLPKSAYLEVTKVSLSQKNDNHCQLSNDQMLEMKMIMTRC